VVMGPRSEAMGRGPKGRPSSEVMVIMQIHVNRSAITCLLIRSEGVKALSKKHRIRPAHMGLHEVA
jgi:hypothetical protein